MMKRLTHTIALLFLALSVNAQAGLWLQRSQAAPPGNTGILDSYAGAAFAAAPDVLIYGGYADTMATDNIAGSQTNGTQGAWTVTLYRDSDGAYSSFEWNEIGALDDPGGWCAGVNCFVRRLWDQSGNANHANQTTVGNMPKLVDSVTGLVVENGKAALLSTSQTKLDITGSPNSNDFCAIFVGKSTAVSTSNNHALAITNKILFKSAQNVSGEAYPRFQPHDGGYKTAEYSVNVINQQVLIFGTTSAGTAYIFVNSNAGSTSNIGSITSNNNTINIFYSEITASTNHTGPAQFIALYPVSQLANRTAIETAINTEYSIY